MGSEQFVLADPLLSDLKIRSNPAAIVQSLSDVFSSGFNSTLGYTGSGLIHSFNRNFALLGFICSVTSVLLHKTHIKILYWP